MGGPVPTKGIVATVVANGHYRGKWRLSWQNKNGPKWGHVHITKLGLTRLMPSYLAKVAPAHNLPSLEEPARGMAIDPVRPFP